MSRCDIKKPSDLSNVAPQTKIKIQNATIKERASLEGIGCDRKIEALPNYRKAPCETVAAKGQNNSEIVMGRDRPAGLLSGYGGRGDAQAGSIDIVVGRKSSEIFETDENGEKIYIDPDFEKDAARIHISQKTDIDSNFNLADGNVGRSTARSGIGIKADSVRVIGREGIKLVTLTEDQNSLGGALVQIKGIDLIAGNDDKDLQPMVKGNDLLSILNHMMKRLSSLNSLVNSLATKQVALDAALAAHTHIVAPTIPPVAVPSIEAAIACTVDATQLAVLDFPSHINNLVNIKTSQLDHLKAGGSNFIISKYNRTN